MPDERKTLENQGRPKATSGSGVFSTETGGAVATGAALTEGGGTRRGGGGSVCCT